MKTTENFESNSSAGRPASISSALVLVFFTILTMAGIASAAQGKDASKVNLPYTPIDRPQFVSASQATFLGPNYLVIGVAQGREAKAYPVTILAQHGIVQDQMPDGPIVVTWCGYCNTAVVFKATVNGKILDLETAGVIGSNEVFKDRVTGSKWQQSSLDAISGPMKGAHLQIYPFLFTSWNEWRRQHPSTLVLKPLPGYAARLVDKNKIIDQNRVGIAGPAPFGVVGDDKRLAPRQTVVGLETGGAAKAYPISELEKTRVVNDRVGGNPVVIIHQPASDTTTAFLATVDGKTLRFRATGAAGDRLVDLETHSTWNAYGSCLAGPLKGTHLKRLILEPEFWFAWSEFHPGTELYVLPGSHKA